MYVRNIGSVILLLVTILGCIILGPSRPTTYSDSSFSFQYPESWQTMSELWGDHYQSGKEYYRLGVTEIITVTSVQKQGESGAWFAVASTPLAGSIDLEYVARESYAPFMDELRDYTDKAITVAGMDAFEATYQRPWGEPWWQFRDVWLANNTVLYVLSSHTSPGNFSTYQEDFDLILHSFVFK